VAADGNGTKAAPLSAPDIPRGPSPPAGTRRKQRRPITRADLARFVKAVKDSDQAVVDDTVVRLSHTRPWLAPLTLAIGAFAML
jgi:hypothetical protein